MGAMKLLCVGDVHLGRQPSRLPAELTAQLPAGELGPAAAWRRAVDLALESGVDAVLLAGDVVEQEDDFFEAYGDLRRGVERLAKDGVQVLAVSGNHDVEVLPRLADTLPGFHLVGRDGRWEVADVEGRDGRRAHVIGWSFPRRRFTVSPFADHAAAAPAAMREAKERRAGPVIGLLHCDRDAAPGSPYAPLRSVELEGATVADAWLLGHVHQPDGLAPPRPIGYLGSLTGLDPGEAGVRGPWRLEWAAGGAEPVLEHLPLAPLRWEEVEVAVDGIEAAEDVHGLAADALDRVHEERIAGGPFRPRAVGCRLRFQGRSAIGPSLEHALTASDPCRLLHWREDVAYFVHDWRMAVTPAVDLAALARVADPPGLVARKLLLLRAPPESEERQALIDDARRHLEAGRRHGPRSRPHFRALAAATERPSDREVADLLERAALGALDALLAQRGARGGGAPAASPPGPA